ncbi:hypothetical protein [Solitalea lacus]|uniref:hypothetical protein n=1 Tax=Solitalea lacus TaxID=2911172 RepID=UPI001EDC137D|nr:hypothetical protein [Solitalea lacus]UKJ09202.1 hypothetical protein L2B55_08605 [Solitalea lacus]
MIKRSNHLHTYTCDIPGTITHWCGCNEHRLKNINGKLLTFIKNMRKAVLIMIFFALGVVQVKAQSEIAKDIEMARMRSGGLGSAKSNKIFKKVVQLLDASTDAPVANHYFNVYKNGTSVYPSQTDNKGYGTIIMRNDNYYSKVELELNPKASDDGTLTMRNTQTYKLVKGGVISFPSRKEVVDTVKVYVKKIN